MNLIIVPSGLADMPDSGEGSVGETVPSLVVMLDWEASMEMNGLSEGQNRSSHDRKLYGVKDYVVVQKGDVKIAVSMFGVDARVLRAPTCELLFTVRDPAEPKKTVEEIKKNEKVDMIACVFTGNLRH